MQNTLVVLKKKISSKKNIQKLIFFKFFILVAMVIASINCVFVQKSSATTQNNHIPALEATFGAWSVLTITQNKGKMCYFVSSPIETIGNHNAKRDPYIMVVLFGANKLEVSIRAGFLYKTNSIVYVSIDGKQLRFKAENDFVAWPERHKTDKDIAKLMQQGKKLLVFYESFDRTYAVDTYTLDGFTKAYKYATSICNKQQSKNLSTDNGETILDNLPYPQTNIEENNGFSYQDFESILDDNK